MKTSLKLILLGSCLVALTNCGEKAQNPLHGYSVINTAVPPHEKEISTRFEIPADTHKITQEGDLHFIVGQEKSVTFKVEILAAYASELKFNLKLDESWASQGAKISSKSASEYVLTFKPSLQLLANSEESRNLPLELELVVLPSSSARAKNLFAGIHKKKSFQATIAKDASVPRIADRVLSTKGTTITLGASTDITFAVSAAGIESADELQILFDAQTQKPSRELLQTSGHYGLTSEAQLISSHNKAGILTATYKVTFDANKFWERTLIDIRADAGLRSKLQAARYTQAEARLVITAKSAKSSQAVNKEVFLVVDLGMAPSEVALQASEAGLAVESRKRGLENFSLKAVNGRGNLSLKEVKLDDATAVVKSGSHTIDSALANVSLRCSPVRSNDLQKLCEAGACAMNCQLIVQAKCANEDTTLNLKIKAESEVGGEAKTSDLNRTITIKKSTQACEGAKS